MKKIVSFSLFGSNQRYTVNALVNADLCKKFYPDWVCRIYYDNTVPPTVLNLLRKKDNVELVLENGSGHSRRLWRFFAYDDCDIFISRDIDSHITEREVSAVNEWLNSGKSLHIMRDHPHHKNKLQAGMFGLKKTDKLHSLRKITEEYIRSNRHHLAMDEVFLTDKVYDTFISDMIVHDDKNFHNDTTNNWIVPILYTDEHGQFIGRPQFPASINQEQFVEYQRQI